MRRLMAVPLSVAMLTFVVTTSAAQQAQPPTSGSLTVQAQGSTQQPASAGAAAKPPATPVPSVGTSVQAGGSTTVGGAAVTGAAGGSSGASTTPPAAAITDPSTLPAAADAPPAAGATDATGATTNVAVKDVPVDAGTYGVRLRDLEQRINELKEQIFRSKARLSLLAETVLQGVVAGSQARIVHENKMGSSYRLVKATYALDGAPIFNKADEEGSLGEREEFDVYNGSIVPGEHTLTIKLEYRGHGYGIFSYLKGYRFKVNSSHTFTAPEGKATTLRVVGYEKGGPTAPLEDRPAIRYVERVAAQVEAAPEPAGAAGAAGAGGG